MLEEYTKTLQERKSLEQPQMNVYRILHTLEGFYVVQRYTRKYSWQEYAWKSIVHSYEEDVFLWETQELAAAYLCGLSKNWTSPLRMHQAMCTVVEEEVL